MLRDTLDMKRTVPKPGTDEEEAPKQDCGRPSTFGDDFRSYAEEPSRPRVLPDKLQA